MKTEANEPFIRWCILGAIGGILMAAGDWLLGCIPLQATDTGMFDRAYYLSGAYGLWRPVLTVGLGVAFARDDARGLERALKRPGDFARFLGSDVLVRLYRPKSGTKEFPGVLRGYEDGRVTIDYLGKPVTFEKSEVALVRLRATF